MGTVHSHHCNGATGNYGGCRGLPFCHGGRSVDITTPTNDRQGKAVRGTDLHRFRCSDPNDTHQSIRKTGDPDSGGNDPLRKTVAAGSDRCFGFGAR